MPSNEKIEGDHHYAVLTPNEITGDWLVMRRDDQVIVTTHDKKLGATASVHGHDEQARHFIELGKQQREAEKPTGTIFELDMFRERLEREAERLRPTNPEASEIPDDFHGWQTDDAFYAGADHAHYFHANKLSDFAADLKPLIDDVMAQYCPDGGSDAH